MSDIVSFSSSDSGTVPAIQVTPAMLIVFVSMLTPKLMLMLIIIIIFAGRNSHGGLCERSHTGWRSQFLNTNFLRSQANSINDASTKLRTSSAWTASDTEASLESLALRT